MPEVAVHCVGDSKEESDVTDSNTLHCTGDSREESDVKGKEVDLRPKRAKYAPMPTVLPLTRVTVKPSRKARAYTLHVCMRVCVAPQM